MTTADDADDGELDDVLESADCLEDVLDALLGPTQDKETQEE